MKSRLHLKPGQKAGREMGWGCQVMVHRVREGQRDGALKAYSIGCFN